MNERLKEVRLDMKLSQAAFGKRIGIRSRAHVSALESGARKITDRIISDVCREFHINEAWLRTGIGDMHNNDSENELAWLIATLRAENDKFKKNFIAEMLKLDSDQWEEIKKFIQKLKRIED